MPIVPSFIARQQDIIARFDTCKSCESNRVGICTECGCIIKLKIRLVHSKCPIGKWGTSEDHGSQHYVNDDLID